MNEKTEFSRRLLLALKRSGISVASPTRLAIDFNLHYRGRPVTTQAAHKWLNGTAIPAQDKIRALARWLNVAPEWLRFGVDREAVPGAVLHQQVPPYETLEQQLLNDFRKLGDAQKAVARELIATLLRLEKTGR